MKPEVKKIIDDYIAAYCDFNKNRPVPKLIYENGWYLLTTYDAQGLSYPCKRRGKMLKKMTATLQSYVTKNWLEEESV